MITPVQAAQYACLDIYNPVTPNVFTTVLHIGDDVIGLIELPDTLIVVPAGSETLPMWEDNAEIYPTYEPALGMMHTGFWRPAQGIYRVIKPLASGKSIILAGHSRGAALGGCLLALFLLDGSKSVSQLFAFECPRFGFQESTKYLFDEYHGFVLSTVNGIDPVPDVPIFPYAVPFIQTELGHAPGGDDDIDPIAWHRGKTIYDGVVAMFG